jgi:hypothetical protein
LKILQTISFVFKILQKSMGRKWFVWKIMQKIDTGGGTLCQHQFQTSVASRRPAIFTCPRDRQPGLAGLTVATSKAGPALGGMFFA